MEAKTEIQSRLIRPKEASKYLAISDRKLWAMTKAKELPALKFGRAVRYDILDLNTFIDRAKGVLDDRS